MNDGHRLERLHLLRDRLERLPASADRDWMLGEVRARAVDVETGGRPRPMRPLEADTTTPSPEAVRPQGEKVGGAAPDVTRSAPGRARRATEVSHIAARTVPAPSEVPVAPAIDAVVPSSSIEHADSVDLLADDALLCLDDLSLGASPTDGRTSSPPWARGLRG